MAHAALRIGGFVILLSLFFTFFTYTLIKLDEHDNEIEETFYELQKRGFLTDLRSDVLRNEETEVYEYVLFWFLIALFILAFGYVFAELCICIFNIKTVRKANITGQSVNYV